MTNSISIQVAERIGERHRSVSRTGRVYADFVVDGMPLSRIAKRIAPENISCLGWGFRETQDHVVSQLLGAAHQSSEDRVSLYVCPECGELACGAITAHVLRDGEFIVWSDFAYETGLDIDPPDINRSKFADVGPFRFAMSEYEPVIRSGYGVGGFLEQRPSARSVWQILKKMFGISRTAI